MLRRRLVLGVEGMAAWLVCHRLAWLCKLSPFGARTRDAARLRNRGVLQIRRTSTGILSKFRGTAHALGIVSTH